MTAVTDPPYQLVMRAARAVVNGREQPVSLAVRDGRIAAIGGLQEEWAADREVVLAVDEVLLPGFVDTHVHVNQPGRTHWEGFATATRAAAAGGITTMVDMPLNCIPPTVDVAALRAKLESAAGSCFVDVGFWGGAVPGNVGDLQALHEAGVLGNKCFLADSGVEEFASVSRAQLEEHLAETARLGSVLLVHAEDPQVLADATPCSGTRYHDFLRSRPPAAEEAAIAHLLDAMRATGGRAHVLHLSDAGAVDELRQARAEELPVTVETCPHYLTFAAEQIGDGQTLLKCCPPIRDEANRERLWAALGEGVIDLVASDHSPSDPVLKHLDTGDFGAAWGGISGLQVSVAAVWTEASTRGHGLADLVRWMSTGPAQLAGLSRKGALDPGRDADLVVFAPDEEFTVKPADLHHRHRASPYGGRTLHGAVRSTWLRGAAVTDRPTGRFLLRGHP